MRRNILLVVSAAIMLTGLVGCKSKDDTKRERILHGTVDTIDLPSKTISIEWYNPKRSETMFIAGRLTKDTEIYIDGKITDITKIKIGDPVIVEGYKKGSDVVAVKIDIVRASQPRKIIKPATQSVKKK